MRRQHIVLGALALGMAAAWAVAQDQRDPGRDDPQRMHGKQEDQDRDAQRAERRGMSGLRLVDTPTEAASMFRNVQHSLAHAISTAEKQTGGKAVIAMCAYMDDMNRGDRADDRDRDRDRNRDEREREANRDRAGGNVACVVTCLVGDNKFVRVIIDASNGNVIRQEDTDRVALGGMTTDLGRGGIQRVETDRRATRTGFEFASRWQKATDIIGKPAKNAQDEDLGKIEDLAIDARSGRMLYAVLSFGGFLGMGEKWHAIPWESLQLPPHARHFVLNVEKETLKNSDGFDKDKWPNMADERWSVVTYERYGHKPYWQRGEDNRPPAETITYRERWTQRPVLWQKASDLIGKAVRVRTGDEEVGKMQNLAIDPDAGRILYGIVSREGRLHAVPWNALNLSNNAEHFVLNVDRSVLDRANAFDDNSWPNLTDRSWSTTVYRTYSVEPYWDDNEGRRGGER